MLILLGKMQWLKARDIQAISSKPESGCGDSDDDVARSYGIETWNTHAGVLCVALLGAGLAEAGR